MKSLFCFLILILCLGTLPVQGQSRDERAIAQAVERLRQVMLKPDSLQLKDIAADELVYVHSSGTVRDKRGFIDEFMQGKTVVTSLTISEQTIKLAGSNAIVRHHLTGDTNNKNVPGKLDIIILQVWIKKLGHWKLLARQAAKIPV